MCALLRKTYSRAAPITPSLAHTLMKRMRAYYIATYLSGL